MRFYFNVRERSAFSYLTFIPKPIRVLLALGIIVGCYYLFFVR